MDKPQNKYIAVTYKLQSENNGEIKFVEEATEDRPFHFISGFGVTLEAFEAQVVNLGKGDNFDFSLTKEEAYSDYEQARVLDLDRDVFCINGHFDHEHIYKDAIVPLQNEDGNRLYGRVLSVGEEKVRMDLNHPLAGQQLHFSGRVLESREASNAEIQAMLNHLSGDGCGCGCGECGGECEGGCDDHHEHHHGDCCCHHH